jgi:hypothetical protein
VTEDMGGMTNRGPAGEDYTAWLNDLKARVASARQRAALAVSRELVLLYWQIGRDIAQRPWLTICARHSPTCAAFPRATSNTYMRAFAAGVAEQGNLCSRLLHNCHGSICARCSTN